jgi:tail tube protein
MPGFGHNSVLGFGEETTWGTALFTDPRYLYIDAGGDNAMQTLNWIDTKAVGLLGTAVELSFPGTKDARGDFTFEVPYSGMERLLKHGLGQSWFDETPYGADIANRFIFDVNDDLTEMKHGAGLSGKKGLTFKMRRDIQTFVYNGAKINTLEFSIAKDQNLKCKVGFIGKGFLDEANSGTPAYANAGFFNYYQGVFKYTSVAAGTVFVPISNWSMTFNNNLDEDRYLFSGQDRKEPVRKAKIECTQRFTAEFGNTSSPVNQNTLAMFSDFASGAACSTEMTFTGADIPSSTKKFKISFFSATTTAFNGAGPPHQARIRAYPVKAENEGIIRADIEMKHYRDAAETAPTYVSPGTSGSGSLRELRIVIENNQGSTAQ